jgi:hypothetical protein
LWAWWCWPARASGTQLTGSKDDAAKLLGKPVERTTKEQDACLYYGPAGLSSELARERMHDVISASKTKEGPDAAAAADAVTNLAGSLANAAGQFSGTMGTDRPLLTVVIANDGKAQMTALSATKAMVSGFKGAAAEIPNLGDRALRLGNLGLNVLEGDTLVRIVPGPVPDAYDKSVAIARKILTKL